MAENKLLSYYEDLFAQFIGLYGYSVEEAYIKAYGVIAPTVNDLNRARNLTKRKHIKEKIFEYKQKTEKKNIEIAKGIVPFERADAMNSVQKMLTKCNEALNVPKLSDDETKRLLEVLTTSSRLKVKTIKNVNGEIIEKADPVDVKIYSIILQDITAPVINTKVGELLLKANRQACELYDLIDNSVNLKADEETTKLLSIMSNALSEEQLVAMAYGEGKEN